MCQQVIRVKSIYPRYNGSAKIKCAGTVHSGFLHKHSPLMNRMYKAMESNEELVVEQVQGAFVKIY